MKENKLKYVKYGKYLDDIDWEQEILYYMTLVKECNHSSLRCEQLGIKYGSPAIKTKKLYIINEATQEELILLGKDYFQWVITDKLSKQSPHIKKLFKLVFYPKTIHPYIFYFEEDDFFDYDYINYICEIIDETAQNMLSDIQISKNKNNALETK